jgi:hypothetical protein
VGPGTAPALTQYLRITAVGEPAPGHVSVRYVVGVKAVPGVGCHVASRPNVSTNVPTLQTSRAGRPDTIAPMTDGTGFTKLGAPELYGQEVEGTWEFDGVELVGSMLRIVWIDQSSNAPIGSAVLLP